MLLETTNDSFTYSGKVATLFGLDCVMLDPAAERVRCSAEPGAPSPRAAGMVMRYWTLPNPLQA
jgi:hypothetical protein